MEPSGQKPLPRVHKQDFHPNVHLCLGPYQQETPGTEKICLHKNRCIITLLNYQMNHDLAILARFIKLKKKRKS